MDGEDDLARAPAGRASGRGRRALRVAFVLALVAAVAVAHRRFDLTDPARLAAIRAGLVAAGAPGVAVFVAALSVAILLYFPAWPFIGLAVAVHGRVVGGLISYAAALVAVSVTFAVVRTAGGTPLSDAPWPIVQRLLSRLDTAPVRTVAILRALTSMNAAVNYALALSRVSFAQYLAGSAIGLVWPVFLQVCILSALLK